MIKRQFRESDGKIPFRERSLQQAAFVVLKSPDVPSVLFEAGYQRHFDHTAVAYCTRENIAKRAGKKGFSKDEAFRRLRAQMPITRKKKLADFLINNNGSIEDTERQVKRISNAIAQKSGSSEARKQRSSSR